MLKQAMVDFIRRHGLIQNGETVLAAVSGGADSVALLRLLSESRDELGVRLCAAHLDHGIRFDSGKDAEFVAGLCEGLRVRCVTEFVDVPGLARRDKLSLEVAARAARWDFLRRTAARLGAGAIATGHHRDDQAETVLIRLVRGSGSDGLRAMSPKDGMIIRPLLWAGHGQLTEYLGSCGQQWREDETNRDLSIARNRIRHLVMPELERLNPKAADAVCRAARLIGRDDDCLGDQVRQACGLVEEREDGLFLPAASALHPAILSRLLRIMALRMGPEYPESLHIEEAMALLGSARNGKAVDWPGGIQARRDAGGLLLCANLPVPRIEPAPLKVPGVTLVPGLGRFLCTLLNAPPADPSAFPAEIQHFDAARFPNEAWVRTRREGDRIVKLGMRGSRKLSDEMIDRKIPKWRRDRIPIIAGRDRVLWMAGYAVAGEAAITADTSATLRIEHMPWTEDDNDG